MHDIFHYIKTSGVIFDDRLMKETATLELTGASCYIVALEDGNCVMQGRTDYGVSWESVRLKSRRGFSSKKGLWLKVPEFCLYGFIRLRRSRVRTAWLHNMDTMPLLLMLTVLWKPWGKGRRIVWDQHELPREFLLKTIIGRWLFRRALNAANCVVVANSSRRDYILSHIGGLSKDKFVVIDNFPTLEFSRLPRGDLPDKLMRWLKGNPYIISQGLGLESRYIVQVVEAMMSLEDVRMVVLGPMSDGAQARLKKLWGNRLNEKVFVTGFVPQKDLYRYIDHAMVSIVLYARNSQNRWLCAPNRLYQAVCRGVPVICGCNPPMKSIIDKTKSGIVLQGDGEDAREIGGALETFLEKEKEFRRCAEAAREVYLWEIQGKQFEVIKGVISLGI